MSQKLLDKFYDECIENMDMASDEVRNSYSELNTATENYICAVQKDMFCNAFKFGYAHGLKGGVVNE